MRRNVVSVGQMADPVDHIADTLRVRLLRGVQAGVLAAGDRLPSARELEREFGVDHRVVLRAFRQLADESLVEMRARGGIYVAGSGRANGAIGPSDTWLTEVFAQGVAREIPMPALHEWMRRAVELRRLRAAVIAATADQVAGLSRELRDDYGLDAAGVRTAELGENALLPLLVRRADALVTTRGDAERVQAIADSLGIPCFVISIRMDILGGEWRLLLREPVYLVAEEAEFAELVRRLLESTSAVEHYRPNYRPIVLGRDDIDTIPDGAPMYVTQRARDLLGDTKLRGRLLPPARTLSPESSREIIAFIVRANVQAMTRPAE